MRLPEFRQEPAAVHQQIGDRILLRGARRRQQVAQPLAGTFQAAQ
jgi:hypothetical protein